MSSGYPIELSAVATGDYAYFYFESSVKSLGSSGFEQILMAIAVFPRSAIKEAIAHIAGISDGQTVTQGLAKLQQLSLISQQAGRYDMLPLTREYAIAKLETDPDFKAFAYSRRVEWYLTFAATHGGKDGTDWQNYSALEQEWDNLQDVIEGYYYQGEIAYKKEDYSQAQTHFQQALQQAQSCDWRRVIFLAKDWLADIALKQGNLSEARLLMEAGLQMAQAHEDRCRTAFCMRSLARLEQVQGDRAPAYRWAAEAKQLFEQLGMQIEARETAELLQ
ncbi:MAG TPA: tetratricopeptide repeat protein [Coleofasciculaceae cyanobacterium]